MEAQTGLTNPIQSVFGRSSNRSTFVSRWPRAIRC